MVTTENVHRLLSVDEGLNATANYFKTAVETVCGSWSQVPWVTAIKPRLVFQRQPQKLPPPVSNLPIPCEYAQLLHGRQHGLH